MSSLFRPQFFFCSSGSIQESIRTIHCRLLLSEPVLLSLSPAKPPSPLEKNVFCFSSYKPQWHSLEKLSFRDNCLWSKEAFQLTLYYDYLLYFAKQTLGESTKDLLWAFPLHRSILVYKFLSYLKPRKAFHLQPVLLQRFTNF